MEERRTVDHLMDLVPVLAEHGVTGAELQAAALEAQRQTVIYASVWATGEYGAHYAQRPRARGAIRKMFPGTVLRDSWDLVNTELSTAYNSGRKYVFTSSHLSNSRLGPSWWWDASQYPGEDEAAEWSLPTGTMSKDRRGVDREGTRRDERGNWYLVDMDMWKRHNGYEHRSNAYVLENTSAYVEGLGVPGATLPDWWDEECQRVADRLGRDYRDHPRNPHNVTAAMNIATARGFMI